MLFNNKKKEMEYGKVKRIKLDKRDDLFANLESNFNKLNTKIEQKIKLINENFKKDEFKLAKIQEETYCNGLNSYRELLIKTLKEKLSKDITKLNEFLKDSTNKAICFDDPIFKNMKLNLPYIEKYSTQTLEMQFLKHYFTKPFDLCQLNKYLNLIQLKKRKFNIDISKLSDCNGYSTNFYDLLDNHNRSDLNFQLKKIFILSPNRLLFFAVKKTQKLDKVVNAMILIVNNSGDLVNKKILNLKGYSEFNASSYNIFHFNWDNESESHSIIEIYDYGLNLVKIIKWNRSLYYYRTFKINKNEFALGNIKNKIGIFDVRSSSKIDLCPSIFPKLNFADSFVHFDKENLYFTSIFIKKEKCSKIKIVDRKNGILLQSIPIFGKHFIYNIHNFYIKFDDISNIYYFNSSEIKVYNSNGKFKHSIESKFTNITFSESGSLILNFENRNLNVTYTEY